MRCVWTGDQEFIDFCSLLSEQENIETDLSNKIDLFYQNGNYQQTEGISILQNKKRELYNRILKYDFLTPFLEDACINEIMINGCDKLFVERENKRIYYDLNLSEDRLYALIQKIVSQVNRNVNIREPIVDARLTDGSRVNVVLKPIALNGPIITVRKFKAEIGHLNRLMALGCFDAYLCSFLKKVVKEKKNIFVSGSTNSGKTTLLNCLCKEIEPDERVITIEDSAELKLNNIENLVSLETRMVRQNDLPLISMTELIKASLRMRPDRIIVGEIRGAEALDMLQALNTGHDGSMSTGHSNSGFDMLRRIEAMALSAGVSTIESIRAQIGSGIDYVIHLERGIDGIRRISQIVNIIPSENTGYRGEVVFDLHYTSLDGLHV